MSWTMSLSVYLDENPKIQKANKASGGGAELLLCWLIRLSRKKGLGTVIPADYASTEYIADQRRIEVDVVELALKACVASRIVEIREDGAIAILPDPDWAQPLSAAERKRNERDRKAEEDQASSRDVTDVTKGHGKSRASRSVTRGHDESHEVTTGHDVSRVSRPDPDPDPSLTKPDPSRPTNVGEDVQGEEEGEAQRGGKQGTLIPLPPPVLAAEAAPAASPRPGAPAAKGGEAPAPFSRTDLFRVLGEASGGRFNGGTDKLEKGTAIAIAKVIREFAEKGWTLADARLAGEFVASWTVECQLGPAWVAKHDGLLENVRKARAWAERGRPTLGPVKAVGATRPAPQYQDVDDADVERWMRAGGEGAGR